MDYTIEDCKKWIKNQKVCPVTGQKISRGSGIFWKLMAHCKLHELNAPHFVSRRKHQDLTKEECLQWLEEPLEHPTTNEYIVHGDPAHRELLAHCKKFGLEAPTIPLDICPRKWVQVSDSFAAEYDMSAIIKCGRCNQISCHLHATHVYELGECMCEFCNHDVLLIYRCFKCCRELKEESVPE